LLRVTAVLAEILLCERSQPCGVQFSRTGKVLSPQNPLDPDVDREGAQTFVGKKHHAISNLCAYAGQLAQHFPKIDIGKRRHPFELDFTAGNQPGGRQQIPCAISERALAQFFF
jgi:hypothetical protein